MPVDVTKRTPGVTGVTGVNQVAIAVAALVAAPLPPGGAVVVEVRGGV